jgi:hypothetical protein
MRKSRKKYLKSHPESIKKGEDHWFGRRLHGSENPFYGKKHTEETKEKIRKARIEFLRKRTI